jgi:hypothetical protein
MNNTQARRVDYSHNPEPDLIPTDPVNNRVEKLEDWLAHREIVVEELCPVGALETLYAQRAALYMWRIDRVTRYEIDANIGDIEYGSTATCEDPANAQEHRVSTDQTTLQTIIKYEAHLQRCLVGTMAELRRLQKERRQGLRRVEEVKESDRPTEPAVASDQPAVVSHDPEDLNPEPASSSINPESPIEEVFQEVDRSVQTVARETEVHRSSAPVPVKKSKSPSQTRRQAKDRSCADKRSSAGKKTKSRSGSRSQRGSPIPAVPPLLDAISRRRRLCEFISGEMFEFDQQLGASTIDFAISTFA